MGMRLRADYFCGFPLDWECLRPRWLLLHSSYCISITGSKPSVWFLRLQWWKTSHQVPSLFHVEAWKTLRWSDLTTGVRDLSIMENWSLASKLGVLIHIWLQLTWLVGEGGVLPTACTASTSLFCIFLVELSVQRSPDGPRLAVVTRDTRCFLCENFAIIVWHKQAPEARWVKWFG